MQFLEAQGTQSLNSGREIPIDLLMEIFSRVSAKTIAKLCCVSKLWRSILDLPYFTDLFLMMSSNLLLFTFEFEEKLYFFSSAHPQNLDENTCLVPTRYPVQQRPSLKDFVFELGSLRGFTCRRDLVKEGTIVIINPVTGETKSLPKLETVSRSYMGYDPIDKQMKVLCIKFNAIERTGTGEHQVLTLENGNHLWRTIQCKPHFPTSNGICIDGILYYTAGYIITNSLKAGSKIVCFDVRYEKFSFIGVDKWMGSCTLINYKGKLGVLKFSFVLEFWILENVKKCAWSKRFYTLPPLLFNIVENLDIVGMTNRGEVVFSMRRIIDLFCIYYFNLENNHITRVQIQGFEVFKNSRVHTYLDYVENLKSVELLF